MKLGRFWVSIILAGGFAVGMVWQASRFADLSAKAHNLELEQENWIAKNRKLEAEIALLSSRERTSAMAGRMGLQKALPEERIRIQVTPAQGSAANETAGPAASVSSAKLPAGGSHD